MAELNKLEKVVGLAKRRGFVFPGSDIYGGIGGFYDFGPLGTELKFNIKQAWWNDVVRMRDDVVGLNSAIIMNPKVWEASGHVSGFSDPMVECKKCHYRFRTDLLVNIADLAAVKKEFNIKISRVFSEIANINKEANLLLDTFDVMLEKRDKSELSEEERNSLQNTLDSLMASAKEKIKLSTEKIDHNSFVISELEASNKFIGIVTWIYLNRYVECPNCKAIDWEIPRPFNLMFKTNVGPAEDTSSVAYLRPETAGGIFINFKNVLDTMRVRVPFGIAQIGKAFRNEVNPKDYIFRTREFEQMELEFFVKPGEDDDWYQKWIDERFAWYEKIGLKNIRKFEQPKEELAHYSKGTTDIEYEFPFGWKEIEGVANRTDFDLKAHSKGSGQELVYADPEGGEPFTPYVIEPSAGVDRIALAILCDAYTEEEERVVLKLNPKIAPYKVAVFPLLKNKPELVEKARSVYNELKKHFNVVWDDRGNIGKRYYSQDEIGTPFCVTVDFDTLEKPAQSSGGEGDTVTIRERDSMKQERIAISDLRAYIQKSLD